MFELLVISKPLADALRRNDPEDFANLAYNNPEFRTLGAMALQYATQGITTLEEVIRVSEYIEFEQGSRQ